MTRKRSSSLYGTVDLLLLTTLDRIGPAHGVSIAEEIRSISGEELQLEEGALYPALHRLQKEGLIRGEWRISEKRRRARFYELTAAGRARLQEERAQWMSHTDAVRRVLGLSWGDMP